MGILKTIQVIIHKGNMLVKATVGYVIIVCIQLFFKEMVRHGLEQKVAVYHVLMAKRGYHLINQMVYL